MPTIQDVRRAKLGRHEALVPVMRRAVDDREPDEDVDSIERDIEDLTRAIGALRFSLTRFPPADSTA
jgi:hypothetical protein